jgi:hypothetical protein
MVCGSGEQGPLPPSTRCGGWMTVTPAHSSQDGPASPLAGAASPQRGAPSTSGSVSLIAGELVAGSPARPIRSSPSSSRGHAHSPCVEGAWSPPLSHVRQLLRNPPSVTANRGPWTLRELLGPPTYSVRALP